MMKVLKYFFIASEKKSVDGSKLDKFLKEDWKVIKYDSFEERYLMSKPARVIVEVINDDLNLETLELRDIIISAFDSKKLTRSVVKRFFDEIETGKRKLTREKGGIRSYTL